MQPQLLTQQVVMHRTHRQQWRHRHRRGRQGRRRSAAVHPVGQHQHLGPIPHRLFRRFAQRLEAMAQTTSAGFHRHLGGEGLHRQGLGADRRQFGLVQHR